MRAAIKARHLAFAVRIPAAGKPTLRFAALSPQRRAYPCATDGSRSRSHRGSMAFAQKTRLASRP
jgi:hypothetical protein